MNRALPLAGLLGLLLLGAGCQTRMPEGAKPPPGERLQGQLLAIDGNWYLQPCGKTTRLTLDDAPALDLFPQARRLAAAGPVYADLRGTLSARNGTFESGRFSPSHLYRLENGDTVCSDPLFPRLVMRAGGQQPGWLLTVTADAWRSSAKAARRWYCPISRNSCRTARSGSARRQRAGGTALSRGTAAGRHAQAQQRGRRPAFRGLGPPCAL